jgi:hypothetical protein
VWLKIDFAATDTQAMSSTNSRVGHVVAVSGAALLAVSVFLPWYSITITASGAAYAQSALDQVARQYGNPALQAEATTVGAQFAAVAGHHLATVTAHQSLHTVSVLLLALAALAFFGALMWLAEISEPIEVDGGQIAAVGVVAALLVLFRIVDHPATPGQLVSLSTSWGIWLALLSSFAIIAGGLIGRASDS